MCDKAVDDFLSALKCLLDWFVTSKKMKKINDDIISIDDLVFVNGILVMSNFDGKMCILIIDLDKINLEDVNFYKDDPEAIIHVKFLAWHNKFEQHKAFKKDISKQLIPIA